MKKVWETIVKSGITESKLCDDINISRATFHRIRSMKNISMSTFEKLYNYFPANETVGWIEYSYEELAEIHKAYKNKKGN